LVNNRRSDRREGKLTGEEIAALDALEFVWEPTGEDFARGLAALKAFVTEHGHTRVPQAHRSANGFTLGRWVHLHRQNRQQGKLTDEQIAALDALDFVWDQRADRFAQALAALEAFVAEHGHTRVPPKHRTADGFVLGSWVNNRRMDRREGGLTERQIAALDVLDFDWEPSADRFARGLAALKAFVAEHGHGRVPRAHRTADGIRLGEWINSRRYERRKGELPQEQIARLDAAGMDW
jgi:hypothetical protein